MNGFYDRKSARNRYTHLDKRAMLKEARFPNVIGDSCQVTEPLLQQKKIYEEHEQELPMRYHVDCIVSGIWKWFRNLSISARIMLILVVLYILTRVVDLLIQLIIPSLNSIYTVLGIFASGIVLYEFFVKEHKKKH